MNRFLAALIACMATCIIAAPAAAHHARATTAGVASANAAPIDDRTPNPHVARAKMRAARKGRQEHAKPAKQDVERVVVAKVSARDLAEARKAAALEQAQVRERADDLYAASQANHPIIADARACRRVSADGESVYENC